MRAYDSKNHKEIKVTDWKNHLKQRNYQYLCAITIAGFINRKSETEIKIYVNPSKKLALYIPNTDDWNEGIITNIEDIRTVATTLAAMTLINAKERIELEILTVLKESIIALVEQN